MLAKALNIEPALLQEVENRINAGHKIMDSKMLDLANNASLSRAILAGGRALQCPDCGFSLHCSIQHGFDIDGLPIQFAKAYCLKCPFVLRSSS